MGPEVRSSGAWRQLAATATAIPALLACGPVTDRTSESPPVPAIRGTVAVASEVTVVGGRLLAPRAAGSVVELVALRDGGRPTELADGEVLARFRVDGEVGFVALQPRTAAVGVAVGVCDEVLPPTDDVQDLCRTDSSTVFTDVANDGSGSWEVGEVERLGRPGDLPALWGSAGDDPAVVVDGRVLVRRDGVWDEVPTAGGGVPPCVTDRAIVSPPPFPAMSPTTVVGTLGLPIPEPVVEVRRFGAAAWEAVGLPGLPGPTSWVACGADAVFAVSAVSTHPSLVVATTTSGVWRELGRAELAAPVVPTTGPGLDPGELFVLSVLDGERSTPHLFDGAQELGTAPPTAGAPDRYFRTDDGIVRLLVDPDGAAHLEPVRPGGRSGAPRAR